MSFRLNVTGRGKLRGGQAHEGSRGLEDFFVLRHRETVLRNKKERKKEKKGELKSALKALIKGQEKIFIDTNAVYFLQSTFSLWPGGFFRLKKIVKIRYSNKEMHENISKTSKKIDFFLNQKLFKMPKTRF